MLRIDRAQAALLTDHTLVLHIQQLNIVAAVYASIAAAASANLAVACNDNVITTVEVVRDDAVNISLVY